VKPGAPNVFTVSLGVEVGVGVSNLKEFIIG